MFQIINKYDEGRNMYDYDDEYNMTVTDRRHVFVMQKQADLEIIKTNPQVDL